MVPQLRNCTLQGFHLGAQPLSPVRLLRLCSGSVKTSLREDLLGFVSSFANDLVGRLLCNHQRLGDSILRIPVLAHPGFELRDAITGFFDLVLEGTHRGNDLIQERVDLFFCIAT